MKSFKILMIELPPFNQGHRQGIAHGQGAVVLVVGANPRGQASFSTPTSITRSLCLARVDSGLPTKEISLAPICLILGRIMVEFPGFPAVGNGQDDIFRGDHAQVSVHGLHRV